MLAHTLLAFLNRFGIYPALGGTNSHTDQETSLPAVLFGGLPLCFGKTERIEDHIIQRFAVGPSIKSIGKEIALIFKTFL